MEFLLREEECKRINAEEKYSILEHEMIQQSLEMEEKMAEMERMYMYRLLEEVTVASQFLDLGRINERMIIRTLNWRLWLLQWVL